MKKVLKFTILILVLGTMLFSFNSCQKVPEENVSVSKLIDFKINNFKTTAYEFKKVSDYLDNPAFKGNMIMMDYERVFRSEVINSTDYIEIVAAKSEKNRSSYKLWRAFADKNDAGFKAALNNIPFLKGEYSKEDENAYIISWFDNKWFFFVKTSTEELRETVKRNLDNFFENDTVVNESVIGI
jgi:hypothetical protein